MSRTFQSLSGRVPTVSVLNNTDSSLPQKLPLKSSKFHVEAHNFNAGAYSRVQAQRTTIIYGVHYVTIVV